MGPVENTTYYCLRWDENASLCRRMKKKGPHCWMMRFINLGPRWFNIVKLGWFNTTVNITQIKIKLVRGRKEKPGSRCVMGLDWWHAVRAAWTVLFQKLWNRVKGCLDFRCQHWQTGNWLQFPYKQKKTENRKDRNEILPLIIFLNSINALD